MIVRCVRSICSRTGGHGPARALLIIRKQRHKFRCKNFLRAPSDQSWCCVGCVRRRRITTRQRAATKAPLRLGET